MFHRLWGEVLGKKGHPQARRRYQVGEYTVAEENLVSEGGFAYVYKVRSVEDQSIFALKKVLCQEKEAIEIAKREVEVLEALPNHKNIVGYYGTGSAFPEGKESRKQEVLILLEYCPGGHLADFLAKHNGVLSEAVLLSAFTDVAEAVFCLHSHHPPIQHRDLKLENVLKGQDGFWKVCDFGSWSSQTYDLSNTPPKQLSSIGEELERATTLMYRPPEIADIFQKFPITCAVDIWMLGCILYVLMLNKHPFQDASMLAIRGAQYVLPQQTEKHSQKLMDLLVWLLAQDPRHRPSARKLVTTLWQWQELTSLDVPESVAEKKRQLLSGAASNKTQSKKPQKPETKRSGASAPEENTGGVATAAAAPPPLPPVDESWAAFEQSPKIDPFGENDDFGDMSGRASVGSGYSRTPRLSEMPADALAAAAFGEDIDFDSSVKWQSAHTPTMQDAGGGDAIFPRQADSAEEALQ
mmetsp:Transcript_36716/g.67315  ORF Transcript_36716/g.67315 Transcript_36716/m.67315 type:complete len:467 (-) Transcript_36716:114-1514(-)